MQMLKKMPMMANNTTLIFFSDIIKFLTPQENTILTTLAREYLCRLDG